ncbi:phage portal protein [Ferrimonas aestuarii]|uniref:Phage portal protein n=1 Tax=Ferrimonas aestuarii TaxID=2569539 RepID=A0A4U1BLY8_9GAMM|nr:phage portal protein [Ferrimonas aestuarii]TKB53300.1 phage portal protein [Ferrimonas aestuarii]
MNWLERAIEVVSPSWAAGRAANRLQIKGFEAAMPSVHHKAKREGRSMNDAIGFAGASIREQARWLDENHDLVIGLLDKMEERVVGAKGIQIEPNPLSVSGERHEKLAKEIRRRWAARSLKPEVTGRFTRPQMERLVARHWLRDGEMFGQQVLGIVPGLNHPSGGAYSIELLPAEFVPIDATGEFEGQRLKQGCLLNSWNQITGYRVYKMHPREYFSREMKTIPAVNMLHLALRRNTNALRGMSLLHGVIKRLSDLKDYEDSERIAARIAAALAFYIKRGDTSEYDTGSYDKAAKKRQIKFAPGMTFDDLAPGEDVGMIESNRPNTHLSEFRNGQLRAVASGSRSGYSSIAREYKGSYSSQRQELVETNEGYAVFQDEFVAQWSRPDYRTWLKMEQLHPTDPLVLPPELDLKTLFDATYYGPVMPWIDPAKESQAWKMGIRGGGATQAEWIRARGGNPDEVKAQRKAEVEWNNDNDLVFDTDAGKVSNAGVSHSTSPLDSETQQE